MSSGGDDSIYRGTTPQDGVPWNPPPTQPPPYGQFGPPAEPPKKKRWPWILGLSVLFCGLPLGGCAALLGLGVFSLNQTSDEISGTVTELFELSVAGELEQNQQLFDGAEPCAATEAAIETMNSFSWSDWNVDRVSFTERTDNSTTTWNADAETDALDGRPTESIGRVIGAVDTENGLVEFTVFLSKPVSAWRICTIELR